MMQDRVTYTGMYNDGWWAAGLALTDVVSLYDVDRIHDLIRYVRALHDHTRDRHAQAYLDGVLETLTKMRLQIAEEEA